MADFFIDGAWVPAKRGRTREIRCPADGSLVGEVDEGTRGTPRPRSPPRAAFDSGPWPATPATQRGDLLLRVADLIQRDEATHARAESLDIGKLLIESEYDVDDVTACLRYFG
jgi:betaine-aldehyde dehydrogenase